jgi:hypothetical protein
MVIIAHNPFAHYLGGVQSHATVLAVGKSSPVGNIGKETLTTFMQIKPF